MTDRVHRRVLVAATAVALVGGTANSGVFTPWDQEQSRASDPAFARQVVAYATHERPGTIIVDPGAHFLGAPIGPGSAARHCMPHRIRDTRVS